MRRIIAIAGIVGLSLLWAGVPAGAGVSATFVSTPTSGPPGTVIHASDDNFNCDSPGASVHVEVFDAHENSVGSADTTVAADSTWHVDVTVSADAAPGEDIVTASCTDGDFRVVYRNNSFTVTTAVEPTTTTTVAPTTTTTATTVPVTTVPATTPSTVAPQSVPTAPAATPVVAAPAMTG